MDVDAHLDSGAERSLFNGKLATALEPPPVSWYDDDRHSVPSTGEEEELGR